MQEGIDAPLKQLRRPPSMDVFLNAIQQKQWIAAMSSDAFAPAGLSAIACHSFPLLRITSPTRSDQPESAMFVKWKVK